MAYLGGKQTKSEKILENRRTWCWSITYFSSPDIRPIGKKLDHVKVKSQRGGVGTLNSDPSKSSHLSVWNHIQDSSKKYTSIYNFFAIAVGSVNRAFFFFAGIPKFFSIFLCMGGGRFWWRILQIWEGVAWNISKVTPSNVAWHISYNDFFLSSLY